MRIIILLYIFNISFSANSQNITEYDTTANDQYVHIRNIDFTGNKKTKAFVFRNEMTFWENDSLKAHELPEIFSLNEQLLLKSSLFNAASITYTTPVTDTVDLVIDVQERWYIFPSLTFSLTDRNFNEWWTTYDHDLRRTIFGMSLYIDNLRGRADRLKLTTLFGFNQLYESTYNVPHLSSESKFGLTFNIKYLRSRDIFWKTENNKLVYLHSNKYLRKFFKSGISLKYRTNVYVNHFLHLEYNTNNINDTVSELNPEYFLNGSSNQRYFQIGYQIIDDHRDAQTYPLKGYFINFIILKKGISIYDDVNITLARTDLRKYFKLYKNLYSEHDLRMQVSFPTRQPYHNQRGLGFGGDVVRGYELYVIDGQHFILNRNTFKYRFLHFVINKPIFSIDKFNNIPFSFYFTTHLDFGYVQDHYFNENNPFNNEYLAGAGVGLDIVSYYDFTFGLTYSFNRHKEKGLYLSFDL